MTHDDVRNDVAEAICHTARPGGCPFTEIHREEADAVLAKLAEGAWERVNSAALAPTPNMAKWGLRDVIAATLGLDPTDVPT